MRRILVVGCPGAGKSTVARRLAEKLPLPLVHLDRFYWHSGWRPSQLSEWREQVTALVAAPEWIMDGNYANTVDLRMPRAECLVWLDHPRMTCMRRTLMRILKDHGRSRADLPDGCPEQFDAEFLRFVWDFPTHYRPRIVSGIENFGRHLKVIQLAGDRETEYFLQSVGTA